MGLKSKPSTDIGSNDKIKNSNLSSFWMEALNIRKGDEYKGEKAEYVEVNSDEEEVKSERGLGDDDKDKDGDEDDDKDKDDDKDDDEDKDEDKDDEDVGDGIRQLKYGPPIGKAKKNLASTVPVAGPSKLSATKKDSKTKNQVCFFPFKKILSDFVYFKKQSTQNLAVNTNPRKQSWEEEEDVANPCPKALKTKGKAGTRARDGVKEPMIVRYPTRAEMQLRLTYLS